MFQCLDLIALTCLVLAAETASGQIPPPQNLSVFWENDFTPEFSWIPPPDSLPNCTYYVKMNGKFEFLDKIDISATTYKPKNKVFMKKGHMYEFSLTIKCGKNNKSEPAILELNYPELLTSRDCYRHTSNDVRCSWTPAPAATGLRFFYGMEFHYEDRIEEMQECTSYIYNGSVKSGCDLKASSNAVIEIVFNATLNNTLVRNTFLEDHFKLKPPPPEVNVTKTESEFKISWNDPGELGLNTFKLNSYCNDVKEEFIIEERRWETVKRDRNCRYCFSVQAQDIDNSPESEQKCFDADSNVDPSLLACGLAVVLIVILAVLFFLWFQRKKETIFPKVPAPRDYLSDISNNSQSSFRKLFIEAEEEENCKVTLVKDA
ncbi:PREDICTED: interleukin-13 receptor subunit alpha-1-like [Cyprinodon variegatus]|uniref:Interleukin-13 receptor subunit alpha-1-like n=1 Tax=Cyprinodon variegatus TaxID=28743 RepID=A0A3Q2DVZ4_CYPVA|nr:PREDICTED: interleukin-13 receptor subunit alpha-1-like [Cyprinodon variegatus]